MDEQTEEPVVEDESLQSVEEMPEYMSDFIQESTVRFEDISGIQQEQSDVDADEYEDWIHDPDDQMTGLFEVPPIEEVEIIPTIDYVVQKLTESGYNLTDLVKAHLVDYAEYSHLADYLETVNSEIVRQIRYIMRQYEITNHGLQVNINERTDIPYSDRNVTVRRVLQY
jgi:hypothetical protein